MNRNMTEKAKKIASVLFSLNILVFSLFGTPMKAFATDEIPNRDEIRTQVMQEAHTQSQNPTPEETSAPADNGTTAETDVTNTGDDVDVNNSANATDVTEVDNNNYTDVNQEVDATATTGHNQANGNISINGGGAGIIQTGDAAVNVDASVNAGNNTTVLGGGAGGASSGSDVVNSGDGLEVNSNSSATTYKIVRNRNTTIINQATRATADTGHNEADGNIAVNGGPAGLIITGDASTNVNYLVTANGNMVIVGGTGGNGPGDGASILLFNSGRTSRFNNSANSTHLTQVTNENRAVISQACGYPIGQNVTQIDMTGCSSDTGHNHADGNINRNGDAGVVKTGDTEVNVAMNASANNNNTTVSGGSQGANANADVVNTGDDVDVNNSANNTNRTGVTNNNYADVDQKVNAKANTGYNTANGNISYGGVAGYIQTGNATVNVLMNADVNNNTTNVADDSAGMNGGSNNGTALLNTGDDVTVNSSSNNNTTIEVINTNVLNLSQRVASYANTGENSAAGNIGAVAGVIATGDATSSTNMDVHANTNCTLVGGTDVVCPTNDPTPTNTPSNPGVGGTDVTNNNSSSNNSSSNNNGSVAGAVASAGQVLGAVLPATGPEAGMMMVGLSIAGILGGMKLRKFEN